MTAAQLLVRGKQSALDVIFLHCDESVLLKVDNIFHLCLFCVSAPPQRLVLMDCVARAGSLKSGMAAVLPKELPKVRF